jgi:hypothetical protein
MKHLIAALAFGALAFAVPSASQAQQMTTKEQLVGTWKLISSETIDGDKVTHPLGMTPGGYVAITPDDRSWVLLLASDRKKPAAIAATDAEAMDQFRSSVSYVGKNTYDMSPTTDGSVKLTIHLEAAVNGALTGSDRVFFDRVDGDKLIVKSTGQPSPTTGLTVVQALTFQKVQ